MFFNCNSYVYFENIVVCNEPLIHVTLMTAFKNSFVITDHEEMSYRLKVSTFHSSKLRKK